MTMLGGGAAFAISNHLQFINPLETILRHQWALPLPSGDVHARPRSTHAVFRLVVDRRQMAARCGSRADAGRRHPVAGGEPAGGNPDRARSLPFLQPARDVPAAVLHGADRGLLPVAAPDPSYR